MDDGQSENPNNVGSLLRDARVRGGHDIATMSRMLNIKPYVLEAIERGRYDFLPSPPYDSGFIRSYAEELSLDGELLVQQYRRETSTDKASADLQFPAPEPDTGKPTGIMIIFGLVLLVGAYGAWHFYNKPSFSVTEWIPPIPDQLASLLPGTRPVDGIAGDQPAGDVEAPPAIRNSLEPAQIPLPESGPSTDESVDTLAEPPPDADDSPPLSTAANAPPLGTAREEASADPLFDQSPTTLEESDVTAGLPTDAGEALAPAASVEKDREMPAGDPFEDALPSAANLPTGINAERTFGDETEPRIILHANQDSWIEVRDAQTGDVLLARLFLPGDVYRVPNRSGLTLLTGNAGGLDIYVDGQPVPTLGKAGDVRRNVALDADALRAP